jgi:hypothetical protein
MVDLLREIIRTKANPPKLSWVRILVKIVELSYLPALILLAVC